jgi:formate dehydrogenase maturation protein FdhE
MPTISEALAQAATHDPDLADYYEFQRALFEMHEQARGEIAATLKLADLAALQARTQQGQPLLAFAQLPIKPQRFAKLALAIAQVLTSYYTDLAGQSLPSDAAGWVALAKRRFAQQPAEQSEKSPPVTLAEMSADQALKPYLTWAAEQILPHLDQGLWKQGNCPVCSGPPDLAFLEEEAGARRLVCSRCNSQWRYRRVGCPFCDSDDYGKIVYYPSEDKVYRLYVCNACRRYLKTVNLRYATRRVLPEVERVVTVELDVAARQEGYR